MAYLQLIEFHSRTQFYSDPAREADPFALPDIEIFFAGPMQCGQFTTQIDPRDEPFTPGWYWWPCYPGCLPDDGPNGPFDTKLEALNDAQRGES